MYGATQCKYVKSPQCWGLSPRVRGNPLGLDVFAETLGSIPACTGQPFISFLLAPVGAVYPRVYGATRLAPSRLAPFMGLSPRVRGNQVVLLISPRRERSIPACTGQPRSSAPDDSPTSVYPRVYGATRCESCGAKMQAGLSPRVRGNLSEIDAVAQQVGSIPACTGQPGLPEDVQRGFGVYPRVYGATQTRPVDPLEKEGLSPRVRGNPTNWTEGLLGERSIPACTGQPRPRTSASLRRRVYPRVYGATAAHVFHVRGVSGLSPRVRGNLA